MKYRLTEGKLLNNHFWKTQELEKRIQMQFWNSQYSEYFQVVSTWRSGGINSLWSGVTETCTLSRNVTCEQVFETDPTRRWTSRGLVSLSPKSQVSTVGQEWWGGLILSKSRWDWWRELVVLGMCQGTLWVGPSIIYTELCEVIKEVKTPEVNQGRGF